jgi:hypothetical protein
MKDDNKKTTIKSINNISNSNINNTNFSSNTFNLNSGNSHIDPDEQFVLDVIRTSKQESIQTLVDMLRLQESKSVLLIRILERYIQQLNNKDLLK